MKFSIITLLAVATAGAMADTQGRTRNGANMGTGNRGGQPNGRQGGRGRGQGGVGGGAVTGQANGQGGGTCRVSPSVLPLNVVQGETGGAVPANLDGARISPQQCSAIGGQNFGGCCTKGQCAGSGSPSACLVPNLSNDPQAQGGTGRFVAGTCPPGLRCFELSNRS